MPRSAWEETAVCCSLWRHVTHNSGIIPHLDYRHTKRAVIMTSTGSGLWENLLVHHALCKYSKKNKNKGKLCQNPQRNLVKAGNKPQSVASTNAEEMIVNTHNHLNLTCSQRKWGSTELRVRNHGWLSLSFFFFFLNHSFPRTHAKLNRLVERPRATRCIHYYSE